MIIIVTGSVGTGKTTISKLLAKKLNAQYVDVLKLIKDNKLQENYIKELDTYEVDVKKLVKLLTKLIKNSKKNLIIDSHLSHYLPRKLVDYCVVCECDLKILKKRLEKRKYSEEKIRENLDSEIFNVCEVEATEKGHRIIVVDTSKNKLNACVNLLVEYFQ